MTPPEPEYDRAAPTKWQRAADAQCTAALTAGIVAGGFAALLGLAPLAYAAAVEVVLAVLLFAALRRARPWAAVAGITRSLASLVAAATCVAVGLSFYSPGGRWSGVVLLALLVLSVPVAALALTEAAALRACVRALRAE